MKRILWGLVFGLLSTASLFAQGSVTFDINFGDNPPPHSPGVPDSGATLTGGDFYAILYLSDTEPTSGSILEESATGTFSTVFNFDTLVYASYPAGGTAVDYEDSWELTDTQIQDLLAGQWYAQVTYADATYLGQITTVPEPSGAALLAGGFAVLAAGGWPRIIALRQAAKL